MNEAVSTPPMTSGNSNLNALIVIDIKNLNNGPLHFNQRTL